MRAAPGPTRATYLILGGSVAYVAAASWVGIGLAHRPGRAVRGARQERGDAAALRVPHTPAPIALDGDADDPGWTREPGPARTGPFVLPSGAPARPHSEARMVWGDGYLYLLLYAADDDIRSRGSPGVDSGDAFRVAFSRGGAHYAIRASADGAVTDDAPDPSWRSGAHVSREIDGTIDDGRDTDEEWSLEMAIPLSSLGMTGEPGESARLSVERCDAPKDGTFACAAWGEGESGRIVIE